MPFYNDLRPADDLKKKDYALIFPKMTDVEKKRTINNLLELRQGLKNRVAPRKADNNLLVASWNIKEFGHTDQRLPESYFYIAEIISKFDLVSIQEIKSTLDDLYIIMRILGSDWNYIINDITEGDSGNSERSAYIFNTKRVEFAGLAGEIVLWDDLVAGSGVKQIKRTPYITGFQAGWKTFAMINLHLHPGKGVNDIKFRKEEVDLLMQAIQHKMSKGRLWNENIILSGDFNLYNGPERDAPTIQIISNAGFKEVENLKGKDTNASKTESYDRLFITDNEYFQIAINNQDKENGDVFDCFDFVFKFGQESTYRTFMKKHYTGSKNLDEGDNLKKYYKNPWRKNQISDHFPIWIELIVDSSDNFLQDKLKSFP